MNKSIILTFSLIVICTKLTVAQSQIQIQHLSVEKGLSNGRINAIVQDKIGFIWIGTKNGLNRYDGKNYKIFNQQNSELTSSDISNILVDTNDNLWIGTIGGGFCMYDEKIDKFYCLNNNQLSAINIYSIIEDSIGEIWVGTEKGLARYLTKDYKFEFFSNKIDPKLTTENNNISAIGQLNDSNFLIGTYGGGMFIFNKKSFEFKPVKYNNNEINQKAEYINTIVHFTDNQWLIGTNENGLLVYNYRTKEINSFFKNSIIGKIKTVRAIFKDRDNVFWIGTDGQGVITFNSTNNEPTLINHFTKETCLKKTLSNNTINVIFQDSQKNFWLGTAWKGIDIVKKNPTHINYHYSDAKGCNTSPILSVLIHKEELLLGTDGDGLAVCSATKIDKISKTLKGMYIQKIMPIINGGGYWLGTFSNGLILLDNNKKVVKKYKREINNNFSLPYNDVRAIIQTKSNDLWVGTWGGGLSYLDKKSSKFKNYKHQYDNINSLSSNKIVSMLQNKDSTLWIATFGGGINYFNPRTGIINRINVSNKYIGANYIFCIINVGEDLLWIGTRNGLYKYNIKTKEKTRFKIGNTIGSNTIVALVTDAYKNLWVGTKDCIYRFSPNTGKVKRLLSENFECHINSVFKDENGVIYFGGSDKVISFSPKNIDFKKPDYKVVITDINLLNKPVSVGEKELLESQLLHDKELTLDYMHNSLAFNFAILKYPFSDIQDYEIKLEGFDMNWKKISGQESATYTKLAPGDYSFIVKNTQEDKVIFSKAIKIKIIPPFYNTKLAYTIYIIIILVILLSIYRYFYRLYLIKKELRLAHLREVQSKEIDKAKQQFFTNVSHEIRTPLTLIINPLENLLKKGEFSIKQQEQLNIIRHNTKRLLNLVNELLDFRKLETRNISLEVTQSDIIPFTKEIFLSYVQLAKNKKIKYTYNSRDDSVIAWFDKTQLEKAIHNMLSNAFKFTNNDGRINMQLTKGDEHVYISINDTGQGIKKANIPSIFKRFYMSKDKKKKKGFGIGLSIVKSVVELHSGKVKVTSKDNLGSKFTISIPLGKTHFSKDSIIKKKKLSPTDRITLSEQDINTYVDTDNKNNKFSGVSVLIVEDNKYIRQQISELLTENYVVFEAKNGEDGLIKAFDLIPDIIISDLLMPEMDGITMCHKLKKDMRTSHIPIVILTAKTLTSHIIEGYETGADSYLTKPFDAEILLSIIVNLLNNRKILADKFMKDGIINPKEVKLTSPDKVFLTKVVKITEENICNFDFNVEQLSHDMAMSHSNLYKKMKALTGMSLVKFLKEFRLKRAAQLLRQHKPSIVDVAFKVGYTDRRHFSQEFKKKYKQNPTDYAKSNQKLK